MNSPWISSSYYNHFLRYAEEAKVDVQGTLLSAGFGAGESYVPFGDLQHLIRLMQQHGCSPALGLEVGADISVSSHGPLGFAVANARDLDQCLTFVLDYYRTRAQILGITYHKTGDQACIQVAPEMDWGDVEIPVYETVMTLLFNILGFAIGRKTECCIVEYPYAAPAWQALYQKYMPAQHVFGCARAQLRFPLSYVSIPCVASDPAYVDVAMDQLDSQLSRLLEQESYSARIRKLVRASGNYKLSLDDAAGALAMSKSTLIRKLHAEGETFKALLEGMKKDYASYMLRKTRHKLDVVSMKLGYDEVANFNRAFKRWFNCTPGRFRKGHFPLHAE